jgi:hypothetical protein
MKMTQSNLLIAGLALLLLGCDIADSGTPEVPQVELTILKSQSNNGAVQIDGVGFYAETGECDYPNEGADFALLLTGDLVGCLYVFVESYECSPSGTYRETGNEYFVGTYLGESGSFRTTYRFEARFEGCSDDGFFLGAEIFGRCQHPIQDDSGTGVFEGVQGRLDFKDNIEAGTFPYKGHLRY